MNEDSDFHFAMASSRPRRRIPSPRVVWLWRRILMISVVLDRANSLTCKAAGPAFVGLGMALVLFVAAASLGLLGTATDALLIPEGTGSIQQCALIGPGLWILGNLFFNWSLCVVTPPGYPPRPPALSSRNSLDKDKDLETGALLNGASRSDDFGRVITNRSTANGVASNESNDAKRKETKQCKKCLGPKPPRAHHCSICNRCILAMDHHCPWVNNCVGFFNYRYFFLFLLYMFLGTFYVSVLSVYFHGHMLAGEFRIEHWVYDADVATEITALREAGAAGLEPGERYHFASKSRMIVFLVCISVSVSVSLLLGFHIHLARSGQTTIEFHSNRAISSRMKFEGRTFVNVYDLGTTRNWEMIFGKSRFPLQWMMPSRRRPRGDGRSWPTCKSILRASAENYGDHIV